MTQFVFEYCNLGPASALTNMDQAATGDYDGDGFLDRIRFRHRYASRYSFILRWGGGGGDGGGGGACFGIAPGLLCFVVLCGFLFGVVRAFR